MIKVAVIQLPGSNCELETIEALKQAHCDVKLLRWNQAEKLKECDAIIIPGGFSYQDRIRAGAIASKLPIAEKIYHAAVSGKPVLGICNGCQILAEMALIPDLDNQQKMAVALSYNTVDSKASHFTCDWQHVKISNPDNCVFTHGIPENESFAIPINHGEGRFITELKQEVLEECTQIIYCDANGHVDTKHPVNPNGSFYNLAGLSNKAGNVLALMPHPERAIRDNQVPSWIENKSYEIWQHFFKNFHKVAQNV